MSNEREQEHAAHNLSTVIAFLNGEGPLDGFYFGDSDTARLRPSYWWRKHLMAAWQSAAQSQASAAPVPLPDADIKNIMRTLIGLRDGWAGRGVANEAIELCERHLAATPAKTEGV